MSTSTEYRIDAPLYLSSAFFGMLLSVPGGIYSDNPGTVTALGFVGCLNCRWLPLVLARYQQLASNLLMTPHTFMLSNSLQFEEFALPHDRPRTD